MIRQIQDLLQHYGYGEKENDSAGKALSTPMKRSKESRWQNCHPQLI
jgi:hypothetical protein